jgi:hypothetical protein
LVVVFQIDEREAFFIDVIESQAEGLEVLLVGFCHLFEASTTFGIAAVAALFALGQFGTSFPDVEAFGGFLIFLFETGNVLLEVAEVLVRVDAGFAFLNEEGEEEVTAVKRLKTSSLSDHVVRKRILSEGFAVFTGITGAGKENIGDDAALLDGATGDSVVFSGGELDVAGVLAVRDDGHLLRDIEVPLDGAFSVGGGFTDDNGAVVVLEGCGENFGGGGAALISEHDEGTGVNRPAGGGLEGLDVSAGALGLNDGATGDEEAGEAGDFIERAAAVVPEIEDDAVDVIFLKAI